MTDDIPGCVSNHLNVSNTQRYDEGVFCGHGLDIEHR